MSSNARLFVAGGLLVAIGLALFVSPLSSRAPDGLTKVAEAKGFDSSERDHVLEGGPLADYSVAGVQDERLGKGLAGLVGVLVAFGISSLLFASIRTLRSRRPPAPEER